MIWSRLLIPILIFVVGSILFVKDRRRIRAARSAPGGLEPRVEMAERWRRIGGWIIAFCVIPLGIAIVSEAPPVIVSGILAVGGAGVLILAVSSFISGWLRG